MPRKPTIEARIDYRVVKVFINGKMHLAFERSKFLGVQTWIDGQRGRYVIWIALKGGKLSVDYDRRDTWEAVLSSLEEVL